MINKNNPIKAKIVNIDSKAIANENIVVALNEAIKKCSNGFIKK